MARSTAMNISKILGKSLKDPEKQGEFRQVVQQERKGEKRGLSVRWLFLSGSSNLVIGVT